MVILIGGVGYAGKTLLAQRLLETYRYPYLSIDHLKMGLYRAYDDCGFTPDDSVEKIGGKLWPILKGIIMTNIENDQNIVIEGCYLLPDRILELDDAYRQKIVSFYLGFSRAYIEKNFDSLIVAKRSVIEARKYENEETVTDYILENERQKKRCEPYHAAYFEIQEDYEKEIAALCAWLDREIAAKRRDHQA